MKAFRPIAFILGLFILLASFTDFIDYWIVKLNNKVIYNSNNDQKKEKVHLYTVSEKDILLTDTLEVEYFTDTPCADCIYHYAIKEFEKTNSEAHAPLAPYLKEQRSLGPKPFKIALSDILNCGKKGSIKSICYYVNGDEKRVKELCRIYFR